MTLPRGTDRLESELLVLRRIAPDDLPFYTRIHALPEVAQWLYPEGVVVPGAGGYVEELLNRPGPLNDDERNELRARYHWEVVGPNPL